MKTNQKGFGLIEILLCTALVCIMSLAIASMMSSAAKANRNIAMTLDASNNKAYIGMLLSDRKFCDPNFTAYNVIDIDLAKLKDLKIPVNKLAFPIVTGAPPPEVIFERDQLKTAGNNVQITDMFLSDFQTFNSALQMAKLNITYDKGASTQGPRVITRNLYLRLETVATAGTTVRVLHCNSVGFGTIPAETTTPPTPGKPTEEVQEIDDKLFQNLVAGAKATAYDSKPQFVIDMITGWQKLGLVTTGRYLTVAKFSALFKDADFEWVSGSNGADLCTFFSGKFIDQSNVPMLVPVIPYADQSRCPPLLIK